jgi:hypothetical protein
LRVVLRILVVSPEGLKGQAQIYQQHGLEGARVLGIDALYGIKEIFLRFGQIPERQIGAGNIVQTSDGIFAEWEISNIKQGSEMIAQGVRIGAVHRIIDANVDRSPTGLDSMVERSGQIQGLDIQLKISVPGIKGSQIIRAPRSQDSLFISLVSDRSTFKPGFFKLRV